MKEKKERTQSYNGMAQWYKPWNVNIMKVESEVQISARICITEELKLERNSSLVLPIFSCMSDHTKYCTLCKISIRSATPEVRYATPWETNSNVFVYGSHLEVFVD